MFNSFSSLNRNITTSKNNNNKQIIAKPTNITGVRSTAFTSNGFTLTWSGGVGTGTSYTYTIYTYNNDNTIGASLTFTTTGSGSGVIISNISTSNSIWYVTITATNTIGSVSTNVIIGKIAIKYTFESTSTTYDSTLGITKLTDSSGFIDRDNPKSIIIGIFCISSYITFWGFMSKWTMFSEPNN
jgi:hypothetical protein